MPRKPKPRQTALSFSKPSVNQATTRQSPVSSSTAPRGTTNSINTKRRRPNASILNFFQKVPQSSQNPGNGLFVEGEYDYDEAYEGESGNPLDGVEEREDLAEEELLSLFEEQKQGEEESVAIAAKFVHRSSRGSDRHPPDLSQIHDGKHIKGPFMVEAEETHMLPHVTLTRVDSIDLSKHKAGFCQTLPLSVRTPGKRKVPFEEEEEEEDDDGDEARNLLNGEVKQEVRQPSIAAVIPPNAIEASVKEDHFVDEEVVICDDLNGHGDDDEDEYTPNDDNWEDREARRYLEMLQEQENGVLNSSLQCPICNTSLQEMKEDEATMHVNHCLDGGLPTSIPTLPSSKLLITTDSLISQPGKTSAFKHLMAASSEARIWADAAVSEAPRPNRAYNTEARSLPPQRRTCPFYKLIFSTPVSVTMDAFKYGAIPQVEAYFLSHFHSDHYGGLTSSWVNGLIWCTKVTANLVREKLGVDSRWVREVDWGLETYVGGDANGSGETLWVTTIPANHCPGSAIFLFERRKGSLDANGKVALGGNKEVLERVLHTGDFRAAPWMLRHPLLAPNVEYIDPDIGLARTRQQWLDAIYLDTTYLNPRYTFPRQSAVVNLCAEFCVGIDSSAPGWSMLGRIYPEKGVGNFLTHKKTAPSPSSATSTCNLHPSGTLLVVIGTYSVGKERFCISLAMALRTKIYAPQKKLRLLTTCLDSPLLSSLLTPDPLAAQVHMVPLMEIQPETLQEYLSTYAKTNGGRFTRVIGFRPTGWAYKTPKTTVLSKPNSVRRSGAVTSGGSSSNLGWAPPPEPPFTSADLVPARGSSPVAASYSVPYSEHSSFRELACFISGLNVRRVIPTVNVGRESGRRLMGSWIDRWKDVGDRRRRAPPPLPPPPDWVWAQIAGEGTEEVMFMGATQTAQDILRRTIPENVGVLRMPGQACLDVELVE